MRSLTASVVAASLALGMSSALAQDAAAKAEAKVDAKVDAKAEAKAVEALQEKYFCNGCHQVDMKVVGPGLKEIAAKYKSDKQAPAKLAMSVKKGSMGVWGEIPMPPSEVPDEDLKRMIAWILSL
jgi:cytochrome c